MSQHKYRAKPIVIDGIRFASTKEGHRYQELRLLEKAGEIRDLSVQPEFPLFVASYVGGEATQIGKYRGDFAYTEIGYRPILDRDVVEDSKGYDTPLSKWKRKHVAAQYGIDVRIT